MTMKISVRVESTHDADRIRRRLRGTLRVGITDAALWVDAYVDEARTLRAVREVVFVSKYRSAREAPEVEREQVADMLRYDVAFYNLARPGCVAFVGYRTRSGGDYRINPTVARWDSFGYRLGDPTALTVAGLTADPDAWVTYRRGTDGRLEPETLREFVGRVAAAD